MVVIVTQLKTALIFVLKYFELDQAKAVVQKQRNIPQ